MNSYKSAMVRNGAQDSFSNIKSQVNKKVVLAGMIGTVGEFYDFVTYAVIAGLVFDKLYFVNHDPLISTILVWSSFALGFIVRPLGGIIFGHLGDKYGRTRVLIYTLDIMAVVTLITAFLPTYQQIGLIAPLAMVCLRIIQGMAVGGEYGGAVLMVIEHNEGTGRRGFFGSIVSSAAALGVLLATAIVALTTSLTSDEQFMVWGWRIPFLVGTLLMLVGLYIRRNIKDGPIARADSESHKAHFPFIDLLRDHKKDLMVAFFVPFGLFAMYYIIVAFSTPYAVREGNLNKSTVLFISTVAQVIYIFAVIFGGHLSDRVGRRMPMIIGAFGLAVWGFAFFPLLKSGGGSTFLALSVGMVFIGLMYGPLAAFLTELFGVGVRYSGVSFAYQLSNALGGGLAPLITSYFIAKTGSTIAVSLYLSAVLMISIIVALMVRERLNHPLHV